jgi:hypothetical protein
MNWNEELKHWSADDDLGFPLPQQLHPNLALSECQHIGPGVNETAPFPYDPSLAQTCMHNRVAYLESIGLLKMEPFTRNAARWRES